MLRRWNPHPWTFVRAISGKAITTSVDESSGETLLCVSEMRYQCENRFTFWFLHRRNGLDDCKLIDTPLSVGVSNAKKRAPSLFIEANCIDAGVDVKNVNCCSSELCHNKRHLSSDCMKASTSMLEWWKHHKVCRHTTVGMRRLLGANYGRVRIDSWLSNQSTGWSAPYDRLMSLAPMMMIDVSLPWAN